MFLFWQVGRFTDVISIGEDHSHVFFPHHSHGLLLPILLIVARLLTFPPSFLPDVLFLRVSWRSALDVFLLGVFVGFICSTFVGIFQVCKLG